MSIEREDVIMPNEENPKIIECSDYMTSNFSDLRVPAVVAKKLLDKGFAKPDSFQTQAIEILSSKHDLFVCTLEDFKVNCYTIAIGLIRKAEKRFENAQSICIVPTSYYAKELTEIAIGIKPDELTALTVYDASLITEKIQEHIVVGTPEFFSEIIDKKFIDLDHIHLCIVYNTFEMLVNGSEGSYLRLLNVMKKFRSKRYAFFSPEITQDFKTICTEVGITELRKITKFHIDPLSIVHYGITCNTESEKPHALLKVVGMMTNKQALLFIESPELGDVMATYFTSNGLKTVNIGSEKVTDASAEDIRNDFNHLGVQMIVCTYDKIYRLEGILGVAIAINFDAPKDYLAYGRVTDRIKRFSPYGVVVNFIFSTEKLRMARIMAQFGPQMMYVAPEEVVLPISLADPQERVNQIRGLIHKTINH